MSCDGEKVVLLPAATTGDGLLMATVAGYNPSGKARASGYRWM